MVKLIVGLVGGLVAIVVVGWLGLQIKPKSLPDYPERTPDLETVPLPEGLPAPVARFFRTILGDQVPVIDSAVLTGRATVRFMGITFPARFRFTHQAGQNYRHYIEATFFGLPLLKVNEWYLDGKSRLELPFGVVEGEPKVDMAANLGLWAESVWLPSIYLTDSRVRWEAIDDTTARLAVPFGDREDTFICTFDPETGLMDKLEAMRWKETSDEAKTRWLNEPLGWQTFHGLQIPSPATVTWEDEGTPWSNWTMEDMVYNADVSEFIRQSGP